MVPLSSRMVGTGCESPDQPGDAAGAFGADFNSTARCGPMCQARRRANGSA